MKLQMTVELATLDEEIEDNINQALRDIIREELYELLKELDLLNDQREM